VKPKIGDIVEVMGAKPRLGLVVDTRSTQIGIRYFRPSVIRGTPTDFIWWIHRSHVKVVSAA
jgi:hypothetical protein